MFKLTSAMKIAPIYAFLLLISGLAQDLFDLHLPLIRTEVQPGLGLAIRKYVLKRRGIIAHDTLRAPGPKLTAETAGEVDYLRARLARTQPLAAAAYCQATEGVAEPGFWSTL